MRLASLFSVLIWFCSAAFGQTESQFAQANRKYEEGHFPEAKQLYGQLIEQGVSSSNLFYNLANTEFRLGEKGKAALNYERALFLNPGHPEALANLKLLRSQTNAQIDQPGWRALFGLVSGDLGLVLAALSFWSLAWALTFGLLKGWNRPAKLISASALALLVYSGIGFWLSAQQRQTAIVIAERAEPRFAPTDRAAQVSNLSAGSRVRLLADRGPWVYCLLPDGKRGWLQAHTVAPLFPH